jgi:hypothetical protein
VAPIQPVHREHPAQEAGCKPRAPQMAPCLMIGAEPSCQLEELWTSCLTPFSPPSLLEPLSDGSIHVNHFGFPAYSWETKMAASFLISVNADSRCWWCAVWRTISCDRCVFNSRIPALGSKHKAESPGQRFEDDGRRGICGSP